MSSFQQYLEMARNEKLYISNEGLDGELKKGLISFGIIGSLLLGMIPLAKRANATKIQNIIDNPENYGLVLKKNKKGKTKEELKVFVKNKVDEINKVKAMPEGSEKEEALKKIREEIKKEFKEADRFNSTYMTREREKIKKRIRKRIRKQ